MSAPTRAQVLADGLREVNGVRSDIGLPPLDQLIPEPLDRMSDEPIERCVVTASILHDAPDGWACVWEGWDKLHITGPGMDLLMVVPDCTELTLWWSRDDLPELAPDPPTAPYLKVENPQSKSNLLHPADPTREWDDTDLEAAVEGIGWYADDRHLGHSGAAQRAYWRNQLIASQMGRWGRTPSLLATPRGVLIGWPDQSIARVPYGALIAACRAKAGPAVGEQLTLAVAA
jgi:hypothetical protein